MALKTIHLHGSLSKFATTVELDVDTPVMAVKALIANFGNEMERTFRGGAFRIIRGDINAEKVDDIDDTEINIGTSKTEMHFVPVVQGSSGATRFVTGLVLVVAGIYFQQPWMVNIGASMALGGAAEMLAGTPKSGKYDDQNAPLNPSFVFNGAINTYAQGGPIPLVYGRYRTGTTVVSASMEAAEVNPASGSIPSTIITIEV